MVSEKLRSIILRELELDSWDIQDDTIASTVPGWDSLSHARIIAAIEDAYGVRFQLREIMRLERVGDLQGLADAKSSMRSVNS